MRKLSAEQLTLAKALTLGSKVRIDHDCGGGKTGILSRNANGYSLHCFRCGEPGWSPAERETLSVRLERLKHGALADNVVTSYATLPEPRVYAWGDWPGEARLWLLKAGLSSEDAGKLGAYYHPPTLRVVLPVLDPSTRLLQYWQARALDGRMPKYLGSPIGRATSLPRWGYADSITLTEDILSAYKVGLVAEGWCLLGTSISSSTLGALINAHKPVNVWLDPDPPGIRAAAKLCKILRGVGLGVRNIVSHKDPKLMFRNEIKELV